MKQHSWVPKSYDIIATTWVCNRCESSILTPNSDISSSIYPDICHLKRKNISEDCDESVCKQLLAY